MTITELVLPQMETKVCSTCKVEKPVEEFHRDTHSKDGRRHNCRICRNAEKVRRREYLAELGKKQQEELRREAAVRSEVAAVNRNAILRLIKAHQTEFESYVNAERIRLHDDTPNAGRAWVHLA